MPFFREYDQFRLAYLFQGGPAPAGFQVRLLNSIPVFTDTLATLTGEFAGYNYSPQILALNAVDWPFLGLDSNGIITFKSREIVYQAVGGNWPQTVSWVVNLTNSPAVLVAWGTDGTILQAGQRFGLTIILKGRAPITAGDSIHQKGILETPASLGALYSVQANVKQFPDAGDILGGVDSKTAQPQSVGFHWANIKGLVQCANYATFPAAGSMDQMYLDQSNGREYYWNGAAYIPKPHIEAAPNGSLWKFIVDNNGNVGGHPL